jgi:orotidine-5'-phosphate decarboxylase
MHRGDASLPRHATVLISGPIQSMQDIQAHPRNSKKMPVAESEMVRVDASERLIFPLDVPTADEAKEWVEKLDGTVRFFKIGLELYTATGVSLVPYLVGRGKRVFLDIKYYDIPETVKGAVRKIAQMGVSFATVHGNGAIIRAAVEGRGNSDLKLLSITVLTSLDNDDLKDLGLGGSVTDLVLLRARKSLEAGCDGVISSPKDASGIRSMIASEIRPKSGDRFLIVTPGVRDRLASKDDHKRQSTPTEAIESGADYLVVGRPIRQAVNPAQKAKDLISEMQSAFDKR